MVDSAISKMQSTDEAGARANKRSTTQLTKWSPRKYNKLSMWFGFTAMEQIAQDAAHLPLNTSCPSYYTNASAPLDKIQEATFAKHAYPSVPQKPSPRW
jgi:hypothetical protein